MLFPQNKVNSISAIVYSAFGAMGVYNNECEGSTKLLEEKVGEIAWLLIMWCDVAYGASTQLSSTA